MFQPNQTSSIPKSSSPVSSAIVVSRVIGVAREAGLDSTENLDIN